MGYHAGGHHCSGVLPAKETVTLAASGIIVTSTLLTPVTVYADRIPLIWDASDLPKSTSAFQTSTSSPASGPSSTSPPASSMDRSRSSGLAEGAKIGIGVGVPLGALAIGAIVFFYILRRHQKRKRIAVSHCRKCMSGSQNGRNLRPQVRVPSLSLHPRLDMS
jgi:hypothetical protein